MERLLEVFLLLTVTKELDLYKLMMQLLVEMLMKQLDWFKDSNLLIKMEKYAQLIGNQEMLLSNLIKLRKWISFNLPINLTELQAKQLSPNIQKRNQKIPLNFLLLNLTLVLAKLKYQMERKFICTTLEHFLMELNLILQEIEDRHFLLF